LAVLIVTNKENGHIILYLPVCPECKQDMEVIDGRIHNQQYADESSILITKLRFECPYHEYSEECTPEQISVINQYPNAMQEYRSLNQIAKRAAMKEKKRSSKRER